MARKRNNERELERVRRLLRLLDLEEVLEDLGLEIYWYNGPNAYLDCPCPDHDDRNPSFHVCMEEVEDDDGENRFGWFNCWSHPDPGLYSKNFLDLVARIKFDIWEDEDGDMLYPTDSQKMDAARYLREKYIRGDEDSADEIAETSLRRRSRVISRLDQESGVLVHPPSEPVECADGLFRDYLEGRGYPFERAVYLGVRAVSDFGRIKALEKTVPAVLFPIFSDGEEVNWYARAIDPVDKNAKGRYCPGVPLGKAGIMYSPEPFDLSQRIILVEGIFDRERVYQVVRKHKLTGNVAAVLGGKLVPAQAKRLKKFPEVVALVDGDRGGEGLADSIDVQLGRFTKVKVRKLPAGTDPDDVDESILVESLGVGEEIEDGPLFRYRYRR